MLKKSAAAVAVLWLFAACPAMGGVMNEVNPFTDVPQGHWAYDALVSLASRGVLAGFPDRAYGGKRLATRYEMASAIARAMAVIDVDKADKAEVDTLKRLTVEFGDELYALGVRTDELDKRARALEDRLSGWKIFGQLRLDAEAWDQNETEIDVERPRSSVYISRGRLEVQRDFSDALFYARLESGADGVGDVGVRFDKFYADIPFFGDSTLTVGRFTRDYEGNDYRFATGGATDMAVNAWLGDHNVDAVNIAKTFPLGADGLGEAAVYATRSDALPSWNPDEDLSAWEVLAFAKFQFSERFGLDIGVQAVLGDDRSVVSMSNYEVKTNSIWTPFVGIRFNLTPEVALKGLYYYQRADFDQRSTASAAWSGVGDLDGAYAYNVILDVKQDALKFTSLWLEYSKVGGGFFLTNGDLALMPVESNYWTLTGAGFVGRLMSDGDPNDARDVDIMRIGAVQQWSDKWSTWAYVSDHIWNGNGGDPDGKMRQWGVGVEYAHSPSVVFTLSYINVDWNDEATRTGSRMDEHRLQFRTAVAF
ncbi:MAG: S-layer homology domain-containing protein [Synergistaceae bacterium]|jgi:hypothetical protein|nr:S-layer homology domain-containing protein [Synergistaceae bacterium]